MCGTQQTNQTQQSEHAKWGCTRLTPKCHNSYQPVNRTCGKRMNTKPTTKCHVLTHPHCKQTRLVLKSHLSINLKINLNSDYTQTPRPNNLQPRNFQTLQCNFPGSPNLVSTSVANHAKPVPSNFSVITPNTPSMSCPRKKCSRTSGNLDSPNPVPQEPVVLHKIHCSESTTFGTLAALFESTKTAL